MNFPEFQTPDPGPATVGIQQDPKQFTDFIRSLGRNLRRQKRFGFWLCPWLLFICGPLYGIDRGRRLDELSHTSWTYTEGAPGEVHALSMRLYPPAWGVGRRSIRDFELDGYRIPAGTNFFLLPWVTQRDARFFPEPERFAPERWRDDPIRNGKLPRFAYFPFGGGPRVCVGAGFAMMEATLLLATITQRFRLTLELGQVIEPLFSVTLRPKSGMRMVLNERT